MLDWDWFSKKEVNAFLTHVMSRSGDEKATNYKKAKINPDLEYIRPEWTEYRASGNPIVSGRSTPLRSSQTAPRRILE